MDTTTQEKFWRSDFGQNYNMRNIRASSQSLDAFNEERFGVTRTQMNRFFLDGLEIDSILEVGCNIGNQLILLQELGYDNLYGVDIQPEVVEMSKKYTTNINIIQGSAFNIPFKDNFFDLVFTAGVLIHISPQDIKKAMCEIYRTSRKYIWGYEYFNEDYISVDYHGHKERLWKGNFSKMYLELFPGLKLKKEKIYKYIDGSNLSDMMFLLEK